MISWFEVRATNEKYYFPVDTGYKLDVYKTFSTRPGHLLNVLSTFSLHPLSTGLWRSTNIAYGNLGRTDKGWNWGNQLLTNGFMCLLDLLQWERKGIGILPLEYHALFWIAFRRCKCGKTGWRSREEILFIDNTVQALIPLKACVRYFLSNLNFFSKW